MSRKMTAIFVLFVTLGIKTVFTMERFPDYAMRGSCFTQERKDQDDSKRQPEARNLRQLDLSKIRPLRVETIATFCSDKKTQQSLEVLDLEFSFLHELPPAIGCLNNLQELNLRNNSGLMALPREMSWLFNLRKLDLSSTRLTSEIIASLCSYPNMQQSLVVLKLKNMGYYYDIDYYLTRYNELTELPREIGYLSNLQELNLRDNENLRALPREMSCLGNLKKLNLSRTGLSTETIATLCSYPNIQQSLEVLKFDSDQVSSFIPREVGYLSNLQELNLRGNQNLGILPQEMSWLGNLKKLKLYGLPLKTIGAFFSYPDIQQKLEVLDIASNSLRSLPREIRYLRNLKKLKLCQNELTPKAIVPLFSYPNIQQKLEVLDIVFNSLRFLPREIRYLRNLKKLKLSGNEATAEAIATLCSYSNIQQSLEILYFCNNELCGLPPEIGLLRNLKKLYLSEARLTTEAIATLFSYPNIQQSLEILDLNGNRLVELPPEIGCLINLQELNLNSNHLSILPPEIGCLDNLKKLNLVCNRLVELPPEIGCLINLQELNLNSNHLSILPPEIGCLINLEILDLDKNVLCGLPPQIGCLSNLQVLDLNHNKLVELPPEIECLRSSLKVLNLGWNKLTSNVRKRIESTMPMSWFDVYTYVDSRGNVYTYVDSRGVDSRGHLVRRY